MPEKKSRASSFHVVPIAGTSAGRSRQKMSDGQLSNVERMSGSMSSNNRYRCTIEKNQNGKYNVRLRAIFGRDGWTLPVYFLASSFSAAITKLEESLQFLQKNEERLRFWGLERTDDPNLAGDLLKEFGLGLDRRRDLPRKIAEVEIARGRAVPASMLAPVRRTLADSVGQERVSAAAGD